MKRAISPLELGGSLYIPANHKNLFAVCVERKYPQVRSVIIDFEDALDGCDYELALTQFAALLEVLPSQELLVFVRTQSHEDLKRFLVLPAIDKLDGFVLAKCTLAVWHSSIKLFKRDTFWLLPVLETSEILYEHTRKALCDAFIKNKDTILTLRFGGEDLSVLLGIKKAKDETLYDYTLLTHLLDSVRLSFAPFNLTAPVFTYYKDKENFLREAQEDLRHGLFGKTLIHPDQALWLEEVYKVSQAHLTMAQKLLCEDATAIMSSEGAMLETVPHRIWAVRIQKQAGVYGVA